MRKPLNPLLAVAALLLCVLVVSPTFAAQKIKLLIVDGQNNHDWKSTTRSIKATLLKTGRFTVDVSTTPKEKAPRQEWHQWRPDFSKYEVVVSNYSDYSGDPWPQDVRESFVKFVRGGGGVVIVHAATAAFEDWREFNEMVGLAWRSPDFGDRLTVDDATGKVVLTPKGTGPGSGHGDQHAYIVTVRKPDHPIMAGIPSRWLHAKDELYHGLRGPARKMTVLSSAFSDSATRGTGAHEPITWFVPFGKGRVVTTVLGHHWRHQEDFDALHCTGFQTILARSAEWAATGKVTIPVPATFPKVDRTSVIEPEKVDWTARVHVKPGS